MCVCVRGQRDQEIHSYPYIFCRVTFAHKYTDDDIILLVFELPISIKPHIIYFRIEIQYNYEDDQKNTVIELNELTYTVNSANRFNWLGSFILEPYVIG